MKVKKTDIITNLRNEFQKWGVTQTGNYGKLYSVKVITNYATALNTVFKNDPKKVGAIEGINLKSIFECKDLKRFSEIRATIEGHPRFEAANKRCHHDLSSGLALYEKFLEYYCQDDVYLDEHYKASLQIEYDEAKKHSFDEIKKRLQHKRIKKKYICVVSRQIKRDQDIVLFALKRANGICDLCGEKAPFSKKDGEPYLECHHVTWLSKGGTDTMDNVLALCPNCHRACHVLNSTELIEKMKMKLDYYSKDL